MRFPAVSGLIDILSAWMVVHLKRDDKAMFGMPGSRIRACAHDIAGVSSRQPSGADLTFATLVARNSQSERQIQSSTGINIFWWSFDSNIRKSACGEGVRMLESDH
jgi:hypothetical protein